MEVKGDANYNCAKTISAQKPCSNYTGTLFLENGYECICVDDTQLCDSCHDSVNTHTRTCRVHPGTSD